MSTIPDGLRHALWGLGGGVYVIRGTVTRTVKVGHSCRMYERVRMLACAQGEPQEVLAMFPGADLATEQSIHRLLRTDCVRGREWFREGDATRAWLDSIPEGNRLAGIVVERELTPVRHRETPEQRDARRREAWAYYLKREGERYARHGHTADGAGACRQCRNAMANGQKRRAFYDRSREAFAARGLDGVRAAVAGAA